MALQSEIQRLTDDAATKQAQSEAKLQALQLEYARVRELVVESEDLTLLQEVAVYEYQHPLKDAVAYQQRLDQIQAEIKSMVRKDGGAITAISDWLVNGSAAQGRTMVRETSKLMLRAFNAEADGLVRSLKPRKLTVSIERLRKVAKTIERLGKTMQIRIAPQYLRLRESELRLTADFLHKMETEKEQERRKRAELKEERKVQREMQRQREKLEKERRHFQNALQALLTNGNQLAAQRMREQIEGVDKTIADVELRAANTRAGYVYVISNVGSFGVATIKVGMTRRLDPLDRIRELSDASVPFNFDVHALFFSSNASGIEAAMHERLADRRVNLVNRRREFFRATAQEAKEHLAALAGELLQFQDLPEALEYRQCLKLKSA